MAYVEYAVEPVPEIRRDDYSALRERFVGMLDLALPAIVIPGFGKDRNTEQGLHDALRHALGGAAVLGTGEPYEVGGSRENELGLHIDKTGGHTATNPDFIMWTLTSGTGIGTFFFPKPALFEHGGPAHKSKAYAERNRRVVAMNGAYRGGRVDSTLVTPIAYRTRRLVPGDTVLVASGRMAHDFASQQFPRHALALEYHPHIPGRKQPFRLVRS